MKVEAEKLYYLAAELNLYKIKNDFEEESKDNIKLSTYEIYKDESNRIPRHDRNTISPTYLSELRAE